MQTHSQDKEAPKDGQKSPLSPTATEQQASMMAINDKLLAANEAFRLQNELLHKQLTQEMASTTDLEEDLEGKLGLITEQQLDISDLSEIIAFLQIKQKIMDAAVDLLLPSDQRARYSCFVNGNTMETFKNWMNAPWDLPEAKIPDWMS